jgi:hypothetical protein
MTTISPDAIIVRAGRLEQGMVCVPLARLGAAWGELADTPLIWDGHHVCLRYDDGNHYSVHADTLYVVLVASEVRS